MFRTILHRQPFKLSILEKIKASLLCILMILASTPNLYAATKASAPYETNCVVTMGPYGCGTYGQWPMWVKYDITLNDDTPGATIQYMVFLGPYEFDTGFLTKPYPHLVETFTCGSEGYWSTPNGTMYATAPGYSNSDTMSIGF